MSNSNIIVYGTTSCGDCLRTRRFLDKNKVPYEWVDIDRNRQAEAFVEEVNLGNRSVPTILFANGSILVEPSNQVFMEKIKKLHAKKNTGC